jgi:hypothetical protein
MADIDGRIAGELAAGWEVPDIAARYNVPEAYVERIAEDAAAKPKRWNFSLDNVWNRLATSLLAGVVVNLSTGIYVLGTVVAVMLFVLITAIVMMRRS